MTSLGADIAFNARDVTRWGKNNVGEHPSVRKRSTIVLIAPIYLRRYGGFGERSTPSSAKVQIQRPTPRGPNLAKRRQVGFRSSKAIQHVSRKTPHCMNRHEINLDF